MVIVGAGECGTRAALSLRERGYAGPVTLVGAERHPPYERPPLSKGMLDGDAAGPKAIVSAAELAATGIALHLATEVDAIDAAAHAVRFGTGESLPYGKLLLATGATSRPLPVAFGLKRCLALRTYDEALAIRSHLRPGRRLVVIGGGFIGLELAASARMRGASVQVIEAQDRVLQRAVPAAIAAVLQERHVAEGVRILCGRGLAGLAETEAGLTISLADGEDIAADLVVVGIGSQPNVALAAAAGLALDNGIAVDARLQTSDPDILAAGDCCSFPLDIYGGRRVRLEAWRSAQEHGALAAATMLGGDERHATVPWFWSDQYDLGLQVAGLADEGVETVRRDLGGGASLLFSLGADGRLVAASGIGPGTSIARDIRLSEMLIAARAAPPPDVLASPDIGLKSLLRRPTRAA